MDNTLNILKSVNLLSDENWLNLKDQCKTDCNDGTSINSFSDWGLTVLKKGLKKYVKSAIIETVYTCKDHRNLYSNFYSKKFRNSSKYTQRLHFFTIPDIEPDDFMLFPEEFRDSYVGYCVIRPVNDRCLGRTVFDPLKITDDPDSYFILRTPFNVSINGQKLRVEGYPYTSQDRDVTVCAHSALWGVCRYLSERYSIYGEQYPFDLIDYTEKHSGRTFPYRGMTYSDYCNILSEFGTFPVILQLKKNKEDPNINIDEFMNLCTYVESGFPVLASFQGHVITLIGHTINYTNACLPGVSFINSSYFLKQFIVVDDNLFPYQKLGYSSDPENYGILYDDKYSITSIVTAVCPLPEKVFLPAEKARKLMMDILDIYKTQLEIISDGPWVTRLFVTTNSSFKRRKIEKMKSGEKVDKISFLIKDINMPHFIWVMEVSTIDQYKNCKCIGEIVLDPTSNVSDMPIIYIRIGNMITIDEKDKMFEDNVIEFEQYTHNLGER